MVRSFGWLSSVMSIARARDIWGPYDSYAQNPVLTGEGKDEVVQDAGHGELFEDGTGRWWATVLGVRKYGDGTRYPLGRETFLTAVDWPEGEWPKIQHPAAGEFKRLVSALPAKGQIWALPQPDWRVSNCFIRSPVIDDYRWLSDDGQKVSLRANRADLTVPEGTATFVGKRQRRRDGATASAKLLLATETPAFRDTAARAGLAVYKDDFRNSVISFDAKSSTIVLSTRNNSPKDKIVASIPVGLDVTAVSFRLSATPEAYEFAYRVEPSQGEAWCVAGEVDTRELTARDFTGTILGIYATEAGDSAEDRPWVAFDGFLVNA